MTITEEPSPAVDPAAVQAIAAGLVEVGWVAIEGALPGSIVDWLRTELVDGDRSAFRRAGVGRGADRQRSESVRQDLVRWLEPDDGPSQWCLHWFESLRNGLNQHLYLGLFDYECHLALYPPGAFYKAHVDAFRGDDNRKVSTVLYLNQDWQEGDGGELVLYEPIEAASSFDATAPHLVAQVVKPTGGTLVCFLSEEIPHEVLDATADRYSIAGWYRVNPTGKPLDPPTTGQSLPR